MSAVDDFLVKLDKRQRANLERVREIIKQTAPDAQEVMSYGIPGFKYKGKYLIGFAGFKDHMSVFPGAQAIEQNIEQLKGFKLSKGTVQFTLDNPLPDKLLGDLVLTRIKQIGD